MVHFITINWFNWSGFCICNKFRVKLNWKLWMVNLNITIINGTMIKSTHDNWNHRAGDGRRGYEFEVIFWRLNVQLYWWFIWFFIMKGVELIHLYHKTWWEEVRSTDDSGIRLVSNPSTEFANNILYHADICNNWMYIWCIIVDGIWRIKMMRALAWSGQCCCSTNNF